jgi:uncharacterized protein
MSLTSQLLARMAGLPRARHVRVAVARDLRAPMRDGVALLADHHYPTGDTRAPIILIRTPYGRGSLAGLIARNYAERGYQVVVQSVRGTFGSEGVFEPLRHEREDGLDTLAWLEAQPWFSGVVGMMGASYLGFTQWAVAAEAPSHLKAMAMQVTASQFRGSIYEGESFSLKTALSWIYLIRHQEKPFFQALRANLESERALEVGYATVPLAKADAAVTGAPVAAYQEWLVHGAPGDLYWTAIDYHEAAASLTAAVNLIGGWYDIFLPHQLADYAALRAAGKRPHLTIGPWRHTSFGLLLAAIRESLRWFDTHLRDGAPLDEGEKRASVRVYVMGSGRWRDLPDWPPSATPTRWYLQPEGGLAPSPPPDLAETAGPDRFLYDPAHPTPAVGGTDLTNQAGPRDNRAVEARPDVLTYTSAPLKRDLEVIGLVTVELYAQSSLEHTDFYARLCDVAPGGRSINICDGLTRLRPGSVAADAVDDQGVMRLRIALWPTACRFRAGHHLRVQIASGAHPRYARNPGSDAPLGVATSFLVARQRVWRDAAHPSAIELPVVSEPGS